MLTVGTVKVNDCIAFVDQLEVKYCNGAEGMEKTRATIDWGVRGKCALGVGMTTIESVRNRRCNRAGNELGFVL